MADMERRGILRQLVILALILATAGGGYILWQRTTAAPQAQAPAAPPAAPVSVSEIRLRDVPRLNRTIGTVLASSTVAVKSRVEAQVLEAFFIEGQMVKKGDLLFRLDPKPFQARLAEAEAALARDRAQAASARADAARFEGLFRKGYASAQQYEQAKAQADALAGTIAADEAAISLARLDLGYTEIRAPLSGKTGVLEIHPGNLVKANDTTSLVTIHAIEPVRVSFTLPQQLLPALQDAQKSTGLTASITASGAAPTSAVEGRIDFIAAAVNTTSGTIELRATVDNADHRLVPGQFVEVALRLGTFTQALTVPREAVNTGQQGQYVYIVKSDSTVEAVPVRTLYEDGGEIVVATPEGVRALAAGERVVIDGQLRLVPGAKVTISDNAIAGSGERKLS